MLKPIEKKTEKERKEKRNRILLAFFSAVIMILSVVGFALNLGRNHTIEKQGEFWEFKVNLNGEEITLRTVYLPNETKNVLLNYKPSIQDFANKKYYFYSNIKLKERAIRLISYLSYFSLLRESCIRGYECYNDELPLKDCNDNVILFEKSNVTEIKKEENCIILKGNETNIDKVIDAFLYNIFQIKNEK